MPIELRKDNGELVWVRNPFTGAVTYFTHVHKKRERLSAPAQECCCAPARSIVRCTKHSSARSSKPRNDPVRSVRGMKTTRRKRSGRCRSATSFPTVTTTRWLIRAVPNLIPRIPECCTGGRNESYVVIEDPRHFADDAQGHDDLLYTGMLPLEQFQALLAADLEVARRAYANPAVRAVLIRKNQGHESGASQPHVHNQVIGSDIPFAGRRPASAK